MLLNCQNIGQATLYTCTAQVKPVSGMLINGPLGMPFTTTHCFIWIPTRKGLTPFQQPEEKENTLITWILLGWRSPLIILMSFPSWGPRPGHSPPGGASQGQSRGEHPLLLPAAIPLLMQTRTQLTFQADTAGSHSAFHPSEPQSLSLQVCCQ